MNSETKNGTFNIEDYRGPLASNVKAANQHKKALLAKALLDYIEEGKVDPLEKQFSDVDMIVVLRSSENGFELLSSPLDCKHSAFDLLYYIFTSNTVDEAAIDNLVNTILGDAKDESNIPHCILEDAAIVYGEAIGFKKKPYSLKRFKNTVERIILLSEEEE